MKSSTTPNADLTAPIVIEKSNRHGAGFRLMTEIEVIEPREQVFALFADACQLEALTPPWLRFSVQTAGPIDMRDGTLIDYRLRLHGWPIRWQSRISRWEPPVRFVDEQVRGPYRYWIHLHSFEQSEGGTLVRDEVEYALPLACIAQPLLVRRDLRRVFQFRHQALSRIFTPVQRDVNKTVKLA